MQVARTIARVFIVLVGAGLETSSIGVGRRLRR